MSNRLLKNKIALNLLRLALAVALLLLWELASGTLVQKNLISKPTEIIAEAAALIASGKAFDHLSITFQEIGIGYVIGAILGISIGSFLGRVKVLSEIIEPFIMAFFSIPKIALAPFFIILLGLGIWSKVGIITLMVFFLTFFSTFGGMRTINEDLVNLARIMGASSRQVTFRVILPAASPQIFVGLKSAIPYSIIGAVVGEFIASNKGIGWYILFSANTFNTAGLFAGIFILVSITLVINQLLNRLESYALRWRPSEEVQVVV